MVTFSSMLFHHHAILLLFKIQLCFSVFRILFVFIVIMHTLISISAHPSFTQNILGPAKIRLHKLPPPSTVHVIVPKATQVS